DPADVFIKIPLHAKFAEQVIRDLAPTQNPVQTIGIQDQYGAIGFRHTVTGSWHLTGNGEQNILGGKDLGITRGIVQAHASVEQIKVAVIANPTLEDLLARIQIFDLRLV